MKTEEGMAKRIERQITVSFVIVVRNSAGAISSLFKDLLIQDYTFGQMEVLIIDGESTDNTRSVAENFAQAHPYLNIRIFMNPGRILSSGWNVALAHAQGAIILRVDAHSRIPKDFISKNVKRITAGEYICGGHCQSLQPETLLGKLLYWTEVSRFGGGVAHFRNPGNPRYVDTLAYAAYRRDVFKAVGGYDERLVRNQDMEIHYRMKQAGFKFFFDPEIFSYHSVRGTMKSFLKQQFGNGFWVGLIMGVQPKSFRLRHFVPFIFLFAISLTTIFGLYSSLSSWAWLLLIVIFSSYLSVAILFTIRTFLSIKGWGKLFCIFLPCSFFLMHISYGIGTLCGFTKMPFFVWKTCRYKIPHPIK